MQKLHADNVLSNLPQICMYYKCAQNHQQTLKYGKGSSARYFSTSCRGSYLSLSITKSVLTLQTSVSLTKTFLAAKSL